MISRLVFTTIITSYKSRGIIFMIKDKIQIKSEWWLNLKIKISKYKNIEVNLFFLCVYLHPLIFFCFEVLVNLVFKFILLSVTT